MNTLAAWLRGVPMLVLGLAAALGVALEHWLRLPVWGWFPALLVGAVAALIARGSWQRGTAVVVAVICAFGIFHGLRLPLGNVLERVETPQVVRLEGVTVAEAKVTPYRTTVLVRVRDWEGGEAWLPARGQTLLVTWQGPPPGYGQAVRVRGSLSRIASPPNPGPWDRAAWHAQRGVHFQVNSLYARDCAVRPERGWQGNPALGAGLRAREWMAAQLRLGLEDTPVTVGIIQGLVLGVTDSSEPGLFDLFRETGTLHLFAVSGLHVGMAGVFFGTVLRLFGLGRRGVAAALIPLLVAYAVVTGLQVPVVRSTVIAVVFCVAVLLFRQPNLLNCTGASAFLLLLWDTRQGLQAGFQFSFCVVLMIIALGELARARFGRVGAPDAFLPRSLWTWRQQRWQWLNQAWIGLVASSVAAWIGSLPLSLGYTHMVSWVSFPANLVVVPLSFPVVVSGLLAVSVAWIPWVGPWLAATCNQFSWAMVQCIMLILNAFWQVPGGYQYGPLDLGRRQAFSMTVLSLPRGGGATELSVPGERWLVDTGGDIPFLAMAEPALRYDGMTRARGLILTHQDSGHIGGLAEAVALLNPQEVYAGPRLDLAPEAAMAGAPRVLAQGDQLTLGRETTLEVLWPPLALRSGVADDRCLVLRVTSPAGKVLMMNDSGIATESALLRAGVDLRADVLVLHGHSGDVYGSEAFLKAVAPREVILAGESKNPPLFVARPDPRLPDSRIWRTAWLGAVRVSMDTDAGEGLRVEALR